MFKAGKATKILKTWDCSFSVRQIGAGRWIHETRVRGVDETRGVGPTRGPQNDPATRGSTPDDGRADDVHMCEPKEITKEKVAKAQQEPSGFKGEKLMPGFDSPINKDAKPQHTTVDRGAKYHTWSRQEKREFCASPIVDPLHKSSVKNGAVLKEVKKKVVLSKSGEKWVWWEAPAGFPGHFGVYRAGSERDERLVHS